MLNNLLSIINNDEIKKGVEELFSDELRTISLTLIDKSGNQVPKMETIENIMEAVKHTSLEKYSSYAVKTKIMDTEPIPKKILSETHNTDNGITEYNLPNGIKVFIKPTNYNKDQIAFKAFNYGGVSSAGNNVEYWTANQILKEMAIDKYKKSDLIKILKAKNINYEPNIDIYSHGISGDVNGNNLEPLFQLIHLQFTALNKDSLGYEKVKEIKRQKGESEKKNPWNRFVDSLKTNIYNGVSWNNGYYYPEYMSLWNLDKSFSFMKRLFTATSGFQFIFVGDIDMNKMRILCEKYLASIPISNYKPNYKRYTTKRSFWIIEKEFNIGSGVESQTHIIFDGDYNYSSADEYYIKTMCKVLENRLFKILREEKGGTYDVQVIDYLTKIPRSVYNIRLYFSCSPKRIAELSKYVFNEIENLKTVGPSDEELLEIKQAQTISFNDNIKSNNYWLDRLYNRIYNKEYDNIGINNEQELIKSLTSDAIKNTAKKYFDDKHYYKFTLSPNNANK